MTSTALATTRQAGAALALQPGQIAWDEMQLAALGQLGLRDAGDGDRAVFLHVCQRTGLDPFARQIYMINRRERVPGSQNQWRDKWTIQTGIEGFRVSRDRAERKAGVRGVLGRAVFYDPEGNEHKVWVQPRPPVACEITYTVRDATGETPYTSVLRFDEYRQTDANGNLTGQWRTKPAHMLEKCTEADVYRKAFPQDFSGLALDDAMPPPDPAPDPGTVRRNGRVTAGEILGSTAAPDASPAAAVTPDTAQEPARTPVARAAAGEAHVPPPEDEPGTVSPGQLTHLHTLFTKLGFGSEDREQKLAIACVLTGRELTGPHDGRTSKNLSWAEAAALVNRLGGFGSRDDLIAWMAEHDDYVRQETSPEGTT